MPDQNQNIAVASELALLNERGSVNEDRLKVIHAEQRNEFATIKTLLDGGSTPEKGIIVRLDRLEEISKRQDFWIRLVAGGLITALIGAGFARFTGGPVPAAPTSTERVGK